MNRSSASKGDRMICSGCNKTHDLDFDVTPGDFVLVRCSCGLTTKWYAEMDMSDAVIDEYLRGSARRTIK